MTRGKQSGRWNEATARAALVEWEASSLSDEDFAREIGVSSQRLYYWRKRLQDAQRISRVPEVAFVPSGRRHTIRRPIDTMSVSDAPVDDALCPPSAEFLFAGITYERRRRRRR